MQFYSLENCQDAYLPDCLVPIVDNTRIINVDDNSGADHVLWTDLTIPSHLPPGFYEGVITVSVDGISSPALAINLQVYPFSLPQRPSIQADLNNYGVEFVKVWDVAIGSQEGYQIEHAFYSMARNHRMIFNPLPYRSQLGNPRPTMAPSLEGEGAHIHIKDWSEFDKRYGPLYDGSAFHDGRPIEHQYLPFNPEWPVAFSQFYVNRQRYEEEWRRVAKEFVIHFREKNWSQTVFHIYMNQKPRPHNEIPWNLDEPKGVNDYQGLRYYALLTQEVFPEDSLSPYKFRIDISHFFCDKHQGDPSKDFRVNNGLNILESVDIWVISKHSLDGNFARQQAGELQNKGKAIYEYYAGPRMPLITKPLLTAVEYGWSAWQKNLDGILFWNTVKKKEKASDGRDFLIYPGKSKQIMGPLASIRLKAIRRGLQDYEYLSLASNSAGIKPIFNDLDVGDPTSFQLALKKLASIIIADQRQRDNYGK